MAKKAVGKLALKIPLKESGQKKSRQNPSAHFAQRSSVTVVTVVRGNEFDRPYKLQITCRIRSRRFICVV